ncbi:MAG: DEAD/DEAH box helicase [Verrucomicrobiota bacterium]
MDRRELPIFEIEKVLLANVAKHGRVIVQAPTGSGKSTQIPQMLLDHGLLGKGPARNASRSDAGGQVVILQPRRLPTRMLASFVARERGVRLGDEVGYQIRFEDRSGPRTRIKYETEGILLRQMLSNPTLDGVSAVIFDEFHERHLYGDITLARALQVQESARPDLRILVMSATLDVGPLEKYLSPCAVLTSAGRTFPVSIEYLEGPAPAFAKASAGRPSGPGS